MARSFNGSSDLIDAGTSSSLNPIAMSVSALIKPSSFPNAYNAVVARQDAGATTYYLLAVKSTGKTAVYVHCASGDSFRDGAGTATLSVGTIYQIGFTYSSTAGLVIYVDGASDATDPSNGNILAASANFNIGAGSSVGSRFFAGDIAEVGVWNVALNAGEMAALGKNYSPVLIRSSNLLSYWPLVGRTSPEIDVVGGIAGALTGTSAANHPRIIMAAKTNRSIRKISAAAQLQFVGFMGTSGV